MRNRYQVRAYGNAAHRVINAGVLAVECAEIRVCTALDAQQRRVRARELPEKLVAALSGRQAAV